MSYPYTHSQNDMDERKHRQITETELAMLFHSPVPSKYSVEAFRIEVYIINHLPSSSNRICLPYRALILLLFNQLQFILNTQFLGFGVVAEVAFKSQPHISRRFSTKNFGPSFLYRVYWRRNFRSWSFSSQSVYSGTLWQERGSH